MNRVRFGIVGVGGMGTGHARNMPRIEEVEFTAACDTSPAALASATEAFGVRGFDNHRGLLDSGMVDAITIATPHYFHPPIAIDARMKPGYPDELVCDPETAALVTRRWREYFPAGGVEMGDSDTAHLDPG